MENFHSVLRCSLISLPPPLPPLRFYFLVFIFRSEEIQRRVRGRVFYIQDPGVMNIYTAVSLQYSN